MQRLHTLFEQFLRERVYVNNITPATREWYECAWKAFSPTLTERPATAPVITKATHPVEERENAGRLNPDRPGEGRSTCYVYRT